MITVYGEGLIDLVPQKQSPLAPLVPALGGGPFNVAIAAARQAGPGAVRFHSRLSTDPYGEALVERLEQEGVDVSGVAHGEEPTTLAVTTVADDGSATYTFYNQGTADRLIEPTPEATDIGCFGTCSLAWEPGASRLGHVLLEHARAGRLVALDPNIRPDFATAGHRERLLGLIAHTDLLKLSEEEVEFFGGIDTLRAAGTKAIVITQGAGGLRLVCDEIDVHVPAVDIEVSDTIGAGDTVMGTLVAEISRRGLAAGAIEATSEDAWRSILERAALAAALTCSRRGAAAPTAAEIDRAAVGKEV